MAANSNWAEIPEELLNQITKRINTSIDLRLMRSICTDWRHSITPPRDHLPGHFILYPPRSSNISPRLTSVNSAVGFQLSKRTIYVIKPPSTAGPIASSWLIKVEETDRNTKSLVNPLKRNRLSLLEVIDIAKLNVVEIGHEYVLNHVDSFSNSSVDCEYMDKVVLLKLDSRDGDSDPFVLLTVHISGRLAIFKSLDEKWTVIQEKPSPYEDVILFKGSFYAVDTNGRTVLVDYDNFCVHVIAESVYGGDKKYLVECEGELMLVDMYLSIEGFEDSENAVANILMEKTVKFEVFRLDKEAREWIQLEDLSKNVLFLGEDSCYSASIKDLCLSRGNSVLFVDSLFLLDDEDALVYDECNNRDVGAFDFESNSIKHIGKCPELNKLLWPPPSWIDSAILEEQNIFNGEETEEET